VSQGDEVYTDMVNPRHHHSNTIVIPAQAEIHATST